jgi:hypothetical protein
MVVGFSHCLGKSHPGITPFGYCLVPLWSATLLRNTSVTLCPAVPTLGRRSNVSDETYDDMVHALSPAGQPCSEHSTGQLHKDDTGNRLYIQ